MKEERQVKLKNYLAYGCGDFYGGGAFLIISTLFIFFLTKVEHISPAMAGFIVFVGKAWDAVSDPLFGIISDRTESKWGRRRCYFLWGAIPVGVSFFFLWITIANPSVTVKALYYLFAYILLCTAYTFVMVPYNALAAEMSGDYQVRTRLSGFKMFFSQLSALIAGTIPGYLINNVYKDNPSKGFLLIGVLFGVLYTIPWFIVFFGTWENDTAPSETVSLGQSFKELYTLLDNKTFRTHISMYLLAYTAMDILSASIIYYVSYYLGRKNIYTLLLGGMLLSQLVFLPIYLHMANKKGKGFSYLVGAGILTVTMATFLVIPRNASLPLLLCFSILMGAGFSAVISMPYAMLPESSDVEELLRGRARTGTLTGMFTLMRKLIQAVVLWLFGILLSTIGFNGTLDSQAPSTVMGIKLLFSLAPVACMLAAFIIGFRYPVTPKRFELAKSELERIRNGGKKENVDDATAREIEILTGHPYGQNATCV